MIYPETLTYLGAFSEVVDSVQPTYEDRDQPKLKFCVERHELL
ncbi:hypothetical protein WDW89_01925 [Deltaproteobacteria bacterium TL4]